MNQVNRIRRGVADALADDDPSNFLMNSEVHLCIPCLLSHFEQTSLCPGPCLADISGWLVDGEFTPIQLRRRDISESIHYDAQIEAQQEIEDFRARIARREAARVELQQQQQHEQGLEMPELEEMPELQPEDDQR